MNDKKFRDELETILGRVINFLDTPEDMKEFVDEIISLFEKRDV